MEYLQTTEGILIFSLIVVLISFYVLYEIINSESRGRKIHKETQKQTKLLIEIVNKNGVPESIINEIVDESQYDKIKLNY
jgi:hypothetical protein